MEIRRSTMEILGNPLLRENCLPYFRDKEHSPKLNDATLSEEERKGFGYETGYRVLPYLVQDLYSRERSLITVPTIEMENRHLKAIFLPQYGMRLFSLYHKTLKRELLFRNPALQFANLALRNAWFSGGVEWNPGQFGHAFTTCAPLYAGVCRDSRGQSFLRCYEYERCKGVYWQIDFHLEEDSDYLAAYVRFVNPKKEAVPFYWWTNIAIPEEKHLRIFSGNGHVLYNDPAPMEKTGGLPGMCPGTMPYLDSLPGKDASYPQDFNYSSEYFFQNQRDPSQTWEAAAYDDDFLFYDCATERLQYHKMFCWGTHAGGRHWKDYLSVQGKGDYVEIQGGLSPTQRHGLDLPGETTWDFTQIFGGMQMDAHLAQGEWPEARQRVEAALRKKIPVHLVDELLTSYRPDADAPIETLLQTGTGFGAVEALRNPGAAPRGLVFPDSAMGPEEQRWAELLRTRRMADGDVLTFPASYMVDPRYEPQLKEAAEQGGFTAKNHYGVLCYENGRFEEGISWFKKSAEARENPPAYRNLFCAYREQAPETARMYMEKALSLFGSNPRRELVEEYTAFLYEQQAYDDLWHYYQTLPKALQENEAVRLYLIPAALARRELAYLAKQFDREPVFIREGNRALVEYYFQYQALLESETSGVPYTRELVDKYIRLNQVPQCIDFRQGKI